LFQRLKTAKHDLANVQNMPSFHQISDNREYLAVFTAAKDLAEKWLPKIEPLLAQLDDLTLQPLVVFMERIAAVADHDEMNYGETLGSAMSRVAREFRPGLAELRLEVLEASGLLGRWQEDFPAKGDAALQEIQDTFVNASADTCFYPLFPRLSRPLLPPVNPADRHCLNADPEKFTLAVPGAI
jgi:hypothetical protein